MALALSLAPADAKGNAGLDLLCARIPDALKDCRSLVLRIYERGEKKWNVYDNVLDEVATTSVEGKTFNTICLVPSAEQPPSFQLANVKTDDPTIVAFSEVTAPGHRIAPFSVATLPPPQIDAALEFGWIGGRYRLRLDFKTPNDLCAFADGTTLCRMSRAGFAGKSAKQGGDRPEDRLSAVRTSLLSKMEGCRDHECWSAEVLDGHRLEITALARPGDLLAIDVADLLVRFELPLGSDSKFARESLGGGLILACRSDSLVITGADAEDPFLGLAESSIDTGEASEVLSALRPPPPKHRVHITDMSAVWHGALERFLPGSENFAPSVPLLMAIESAWLATSDNFRRKAESPEILCLAACAPDRPRFLAWLFDKGQTSNTLADLVFERFPDAQCQGLDRACYRSLADVLIRLASSDVALDAATRLGGRLRLIERMSDALIVDLARLFDVSMDERARPWVDAILKWDRSAAAAFEAFGEIVGQTTVSSTRDEDYDLLNKKLDGLTTLVSYCLARGLYPLERDQPSLRQTGKSVAAAFGLLEEYRLALVDAARAVAPKVAEQ